MDADWGTKITSNEDYYLKDTHNLNISFGNDDMNFDMAMLLNDNNINSNNNNNNGDFDNYMLENFLNEESLNKAAVDDDPINLEIEDLDILEAPVFEAKKSKGVWNLDTDNNNKSSEGSKAHFNDKASIELLSSPLGEALWKQQEELRKALRIQQELNAEVVKKLDQTVEQQVQLQLQKALQQQKHLSQPDSRQQDFSLSPALSNNGNEYIDLMLEENELDATKSLMSASTSNTAFNGSPMKRDNSRLGAKIRNSNYLKPNMKLNFQDNGFNTNPQEGSSSISISKRPTRAPYTPKSRVSSMTFTPRTLTTPKPDRDETVALHNVTISPQSVTMSPVIGLGLHVPPVSEQYNSNKIDILPTIPGSTSATPAGKAKRTQLDRFERDLMGYELLDNEEEKGVQLFEDNDNEDGNGNQNENENEQELHPSMSNISATPHLNLVDSSLLLPPDLSSSPARSSPSPQESSSLGYGDNNNAHSSNYFGTSSSSPGPSPVLKARDVKLSQPGSPVRLDFSKNTYMDAPLYEEDEDFEYDSANQHQEDGMQSIPSSPTKITRKLTTLPRGSIDIYVKELPDRKYECMYPGCGKLFKRRYNIRSHIQTHLEDRPYVCDYDGCDKAFVRNHDLVRHKKTHQEKSYACPCGKKFNREDALAVHRSRMICIGGKKYSNVVIKRSPRKRGRPRKDESPTREVVSQMEQLIKN
ncbi:Metallothionein expression activator [Nakaseomyces bracarensis]|uniref:Metallothionein expression activator n=1 Tax=Nakaseomyces bracarensis TaxID=273131 RepID=A0ABR4NT73_9SACH